MVKGALFKKSLRDMKKNLSQFISIFVMAMVAVAIVVGVDSIWLTIETESAQVYQATGLSDFWITIANPGERELRKISRVEGVERAEKRFVTTCDADLPGDPSLKVYSLPKDAQLDRPYLEEGRFSDSGAVLDIHFARAHSLEVGDRISVELGGRWVDFRIDGLALHGEHIFSLKDSMTMLPDAQDYGFLIIREEQLKSAFGGFAPSSQVAVRLREGADEAAVRRELEETLGDRLIGVIARVDHRSLNGTDSRVSQFKILAKVFPFLFFAVTALITLSTMSRLIEDQRGQIGLLGALGYGRGRIIWHYTSYGVYVGLLGSAFGVLVGPNVIGRIIVAKLREIYVLPRYHLVIYWQNVLFGTLLILLCTGGVSWMTCRKLIRETPASLLRQKPPKKGNRIALEFTGLWQRMDSRSRLIARNFFRNKGRMMMSVLGITGFTALIIGAFMLRSMVNDVTDITYHDLYFYDHKASLTEGTDSRDIKNLALPATVQELCETAAQIISPSGVRRFSGVTVFADGDRLMRLTDPDGVPADLPKEGVAITRKLAKILGVSVGDTLRIKMMDDEYKEVRVEQLLYSVIGQSVYVRQDVWEDLGGEYQPSAVLIKWRGEPDERFFKSHFVKEWVSREQQEWDFQSNLTIVTIASIIMIIGGALLAFVVLYNMGALNFFERTRDLATLKVLGFREKEIRSLVLTENILSTLLGIAAGIPVGWLISVILASGFGDDFDIVIRLEPGSIAVAAVMTLAFALIVNQVIARKMRRIDMLDALKSVE